MGKNNENSSSSSWLNAVKKAFRSPVKDVGKRCARRREDNEQEDEEKKRGKRRWIFSKPLPLETTIQHNVAKVSNSPITDHNNRDNTDKKSVVALAAAAAATAQAALEIIGRTTGLYFTRKEHEAAVFIQSIFRGYLARRALQALKGVVKLQALIRGHNVRTRAKMTLQCIQSLVRVQTQVCDQRRRLSCESTTLGSVFTQTNNCTKSINGNASKVSNHSSTRDEILHLIERAKECSLKQGKTLAHALTQQIGNLDEECFSDNNYEALEGKYRRSLENRNDKNLCYQRDAVKTIEMDQYSPHQYTVSFPVVKRHRDISVHSPKTPSSSKIKFVNQVHSSSQSYRAKERGYESVETPTLQANHFHRMSTSEHTGYVPQPNYMAATASAMARVRSLSVPRQRPSSPIREPSAAKKRLSFPVID